MRRIYFILFMVLIILVVSIFVISVCFTLPDTSINTDTRAKRADFHFVMIGQGTDEMFNEQVHKGAFKAADELGAVVEVCVVRPAETFTSENYFDMALESKVDGIAIQVTSSEKIIPYLIKAENLDTPVVTFETDSSILMNIPTIGTNSYQVGKEAGKLAIACKTDTAANIAVILNGFSNMDENPSKNLKISGMADAFKGFPDMKISVVKKTDGGVFSAEKITSEILKNYPDINLIVATNEMDTLGIIDVIVDFNKVGQIDVIGYGSMQEIIKYIKRNVIYGTVVSDPYKIGYESIKALVEICRTGYSSSYMDTGVSTYTRVNVDEYKEAE